MNNASTDAAPRELGPGDTLRGTGVEYRVAGRLGRGGMAQVFEVEDRELGKRFALKLLDPHLATHPESLERFEREARALARLDHPNIVTVMRLDRTEDERRPFFLMERLRGGTLRDHMNRGALSARRALSIVEQLARALHYVHARGLLHRDVKPSNVFLHVDAFGGEVVKLLDFGVMRLVHEDSEIEEGFYGTAHYAAPEQLVLGGRQSPETDVYAMGLVLFEALTGRHPFEDSERTLRAARDARQQGAPALREKLQTDRLDAETLAELGPLVASMLCKNALGRPTADTVARALARSLRRTPEDRAPRDLGHDAPLRTQTPQRFLPAHLAAPTQIDPPRPPTAPEVGGDTYASVSDADLLGPLESPLLLVAKLPAAAAPAALAAPRHAAALGRTVPLRPAITAVSAPALRAPTAPRALPSPLVGVPCLARPARPMRRSAHTRVALVALALLWLALGVGGLGALRRHRAERRSAITTEIVALIAHTQAVAPTLTR